ncbi:MAG: cupredoxin domain-containing protein [Patescibacteria group bacterium]
MTILINLLGILLIIFTYWFFFMKKESKAVEVTNEITITVEGGYKPNVIKVKKGKPVTLKFYRKDASSCLDEVVIPDFNIREHLGLNKTTNIVINPAEVGEYEISCGMNMFHGKIKVVESGADL